VSTPRIVRLDDGGVRFENLAPWFIHVLLELPGMLVRGQGDAVDARLYPDPSEDEEQKAEWARLVHPELYALFASAREIVTSDLTQIGPEDPTVPFGPWHLPVPAGHVDAWIAAFNQARLTLGARHSVGEEDMRAFEELPQRIGDDGLIVDEGAREGETALEAQARRREEETRRSAIARIHLLAWLQGMLIDVQWPEPEGFEDPNATYGDPDDPEEPDDPAEPGPAGAPDG